MQWLSPDYPMQNILIRPALEPDWDSIWEIFRPIALRGDTYTFDPNISKEEALGYWLSPSNEVFVALKNGQIVGTYILRANQPALGSHVANAAFMVRTDSRQQGVGKIMGEHAIEMARRRGFGAMQFNFVVSTNEKAIALWEQLGFTIVGRLPGAFRHPEGRFVDALVMYRTL
jgi:ribosomal protein S18 acetylase RimI-like enzyme